MVVIKLIKRLPINLCYDSEDIEFDKFIKNRLEQRDLNSLIHDLLRVYESNLEVRRIVQEYVVNK